MSYYIYILNKTTMTQDEKNQEKEFAKKFEAFLKSVSENLSREAERMEKEMNSIKACTRVMKGKNWTTLIHLN